MMIALEGLCFTASYLGLLSAPPLSQLPQRSTVSQDMALSRALGPGDVHPAPHVFPSKPIQVFVGPTRVPPGPIRVPAGSHPGPGPGPTPRLGPKNLIHIFRRTHAPRLGSNHGFDTFSVVVQIIFQTGCAIACLWHGSPLSARRTQDCMDSSQRATVGTTASCRSHRDRNVTDTGRLQATRTSRVSRDYRDTKSCRCFSTRGGRGGGWGWRQASARLAPE